MKLKNNLQKVISSKSKTFLAFCFCFLFGVVIGSITIEHRLDFIYLYSILGLFASFLILFWEDKRDRFLVISAFLIFLGFFHFSYAFPGKNHISEYNEKEIEFIAVVSDQPEIGIKQAEYIVSAKTINNKKISGEVLLKTRLYPRYDYGDELNIKCKLQEPEPFNGFRYDMYLANFDVFSICRYAVVEKVGEDQGNLIMSYILEGKSSVAQKVKKLWHEPHASLMAGVLYGYREGLGELEEKFNQAGITHIVAISGLHVTIVSQILMSLCIYFYIPRNKAFWLITTGILFYIVFTGMSPSVVRAGIMGIIVLLARKIGRTSSVKNTLVFTAVVMTIANPFVLIWNGAFQLSFLATIGLIYLTPGLKDFFDFVPNFLEMRESLTATLAAVIMTLPLVLYMFGQVSVVSPITNILVVILLPLLIILGFSSVLVSFIYMPLAEVLSWIVKIFLVYITKVVKFTASFSFAAVKFSIPLWGLILSYIFMFYLLYIKIWSQDEKIAINKNHEQN